MESVNVPLCSTWFVGTVQDCCFSFTLCAGILSLFIYFSLHTISQAGNILIDYNGAVKLADFGVAACMYDTGDRQRSRNTFVGTPCW